MKFLWRSAATSSIRSVFLSRPIAGSAMFWSQRSPPSTLSSRSPVRQNPPPRIWSVVSASLRGNWPWWDWTGRDETLHLSYLLSDCFPNSTKELKQIKCFSMPTKNSFWAFLATIDLESPNISKQEKQSFRWSKGPLQKIRSIFSPLSKTAIAYIAATGHFLSVGKKVLF